METDVLNLTQTYFDYDTATLGSEYNKTISLVNRNHTSNYSTEDDFKIWGHLTYFNQEISEWMFFIFTGVLLSGVSLFGIFGNILSALVLSKKRMRSPLSALLLGLSFSDLVVCLIAFLLMGMPVIFWKLKILKWYIRWVCENNYFSTMIWLMAFAASTYFTVAVAIERYIAVCWPLYSPSIITYGRSRLASVLIPIFAIIIQIPMAILLSDFKTPYSNYSCDYYFFNNQEHTVLFQIVALHYTVFLFIIPMGCVTILNGIIIHKIRQQANARGKLTRYQLKKIKVTSMLIAVVVVYVFCNIFRAVDLYLRLIIGTEYAEQFSVPSLLVIFNCAINYIIYCAFGKSFRQTFVHLFCMCRKQSVQQPISRDRKYTCNQCYIDPRSILKKISSTVDVEETPTTSTTSSLSTSTSRTSNVVQYFRGISLDLRCSLNLGASQQYTVNE